MVRISRHKKDLQTMKLKQEDREVYKEKMELAIAEYKLSKEDPASKITIQSVAKDWNLPKSSLGHHIKGNREYLVDFTADNGNLTHEESLQLIRWLEILAKSGYPAGNSEVYDLAATICAKKHGPDFVLGKNWVKRWSERFLPLVKKRVATHHDSIRGEALNPTVVQHWFEIVGKVFKDHSIEPENIYGADETGICINDFGKHKVFAPVNMKQVYMQTCAVRESFTLLVLTCADGQSYPPTVILRGKGLQEDWVEINPLNAL